MVLFQIRIHRNLKSSTLNLIADRVFDHITNHKVGRTRKLFPHHPDDPHGNEVHIHEKEADEKLGHTDDKTRPQFVGPKVRAASKCDST